MPSCANCSRRFQVELCACCRSNATVERMNLKNGDVLLIGAGVTFAERAEIIKILKFSGLSGVVMLCVQDIAEIARLSEKQMEKFGWVRKAVSNGAD